MKFSLAIKPSATWRIGGRYSTVTDNYKMLCIRYRVRAERERESVDGLRNRNLPDSQHLRNGERARSVSPSLVPCVCRCCWSCWFLLCNVADNELRSIRNPHLPLYSPKLRREKTLGRLAEQTARRVWLTTSDVLAINRIGFNLQIHGILTESVFFF